MRKCLLIGSLAGCLVLPVAAIALPVVHGAKFAERTASGHNAQAVASGRTSLPMAIYLRVTSRPLQPVTGFWSLVCTKGKGIGGGTTRHSLGGRTPFVRRLQLSFPRPSSCSAIASVGLTTSAGGVGSATGFLKVQLIATR